MALAVCGMYDRVLAATDGSDAATAAVSHAIETARGSGAELHAIYVIETRTAYDNAIVDPETVERNLRADGEAALETVEEMADDAGVPVTTTLERGIPHERIAAYAEDEDVDLLVVGASGRSTFKTVLLGSTAEALLGASPVPIAVVGDLPATDPAETNS